MLPKIWPFHRVENKIQGSLFYRFKKLPIRKRLQDHCLWNPSRSVYFFLSSSQNPTQNSLLYVFNFCGLVYSFSMRNCFPKLHPGSINLGLLVQRIEFEGCVWSYSYPYVHWDSTSHQVQYKHNPFWLNMKPLFYEVFAVAIMSRNCCDLSCSNGL